MDLSGRNFQVWEYHPTHSRLLLRSPNSSQKTNLDVMFHGVAYLELPTQIGPIGLMEATPEEQAKLWAAHPYATGLKGYALQSGNRRYFILASAHFVEENELELFESPWEDIREPWPNERKIYDQLLVQAVEAGRQRQARQLLLLGADPNVALEAAVGKDLECLSLLLEFGAEPVSGVGSASAVELLGQARENLRQTRCEVEFAEWEVGRVITCLKISSRHPVPREVVQEQVHGRRWVVQTYAMGPHPRGAEQVVALVPLGHLLVPRVGTTLHSIGHLTSAEFAATLGQFFAENALAAHQVEADRRSHLP